LEAITRVRTVMVVAAVINTAISAYYYLRMIVVMFFKERATDWVEPRIPSALAAVILVTVIGTFYFGIFGNRVIERFSQQPIAEAVSQR